MLFLGLAGVFVGSKSCRWLCRFALLSCPIPMGFIGLGLVVSGYFLGELNFFLARFFATFSSCSATFTSLSFQDDLGTN